MPDTSVLPLGNVWIQAQLSLLYFLETFILQHELEGKTLIELDYSAQCVGKQSPEQV